MGSRWRAKRNPFVATLDIGRSLEVHRGDSKSEVTLVPLVPRRWGEKRKSHPYAVVHRLSRRSYRWNLTGEGLRRLSGSGRYQGKASTLSTAVTHAHDAHEHPYGRTRFER